MKVLVLSAMRKYSGGEICLERVLENNNEIDPLVVLPSGDFSERLKRKGFDTKTCNNIGKSHRQENRFWFITYPLKYLKASFCIYKVLKNNSIDLVVGNAKTGMVYSLIPATLLNKKVVWIHYDIIKFGFDNLVTKLFTLFANKTVAVSQAVKNNLKIGNFNEEKVDVIHNGIEVNQEEIEVANERPIKISIIGSILPWKGHIYVLKALKKIVNNGEINKDYVFQIIGDANTEEAKNYKQKLTDFIEANSLGEYVNFTGRINDIDKIYQITDVCINYSINPEPLGTTIYESMNYGKVTIGSRIGGTPEIIENEKSGFLVDPEDPDELAEKLEYILRSFNSDEILQIRKNAKERVKEKFDINKCQKEYNNLLSKVVNN